MVMKRLFKRHGAWYYDLGRDADGRRKAMHLGRNEDQAFKRFAALQGVVADEALAIRRHLAKLYVDGKARAKKAGIPFDLTRDQYESIVSRSALKCEVTGLPFSLSWAGAKHRRPYVPSLDRRNPKKGYSAENCRLVLCAVNYALNEWGETTMRRIFGGLSSISTSERTEEVEPSD